MFGRHRPIQRINRGSSQPTEGERRKKQAGMVRSMRKQGISNKSIKKHMKVRGIGRQSYG